MVPVKECKIPTLIASPLTAGAEAPVAVVGDIDADGVGAVAQDFRRRLPAVAEPSRRNSRRPNLWVIIQPNLKIQGAKL